MKSLWTVVVFTWWPRSGLLVILLQMGFIGCLAQWGHTLFNFVKSDENIIVDIYYGRSVFCCWQSAQFLALISHPLLDRIVCPLPTLTRRPARPMVYLSIWVIWFLSLGQSKPSWLIADRLWTRLIQLCPSLACHQISTPRPVIDRSFWIQLGDSVGNLSSWVIWYTWQSSGS